MALSADEENKVREIIEAFTNGKRLSDLPNVSGNNPFNLLCEVLEDGESKKAALATMLPYMEEQCMYGIERDKTVSSRLVTRIGNTALHKSLPVHNRMRGCLLDDDGNVVEYLNPRNWTGHVRDGSRGQVMVEFGDFYCRFETSANIERVKFSLFPLPGYRYVPLMYVSAYEATVQRSTNKLSSVVNTTADYRGGANQADWDTLSKTVLGRPATQISRTNFRTYARNRKAGSTKWNCMTYDVQKMLYWLFVVEYATLNSQEAFNTQLTAEGYRQGGLGDGVTTLDSGKWNTFNGYYPFIPCGYTDELGNGTGEKEYTMPTEYDASSKKVKVCRYRGIENPFGHIWQWNDGINVRINPGSNGLSEVFVCSDPSKFNDSNYNGYSHVGNEARAEGYVKEIIFGESGEIIPALVGGGSTTYFCDYHYTNIPASVALRGVLYGGSADNGANAGLACANSANAPSSTAAGFGSRLCFIPTSA